MMVDMKEFWDEFENAGITKGTKIMIQRIRNKQFVFLWERGGKQFVERCEPRDLITLVKWASSGRNISYGSDGRGNLWAQDFLDCVAIDEERVKELIKQKGEL